MSQQCGGNDCIEKASITLDINKSVMQELRIIFSTGQALIKYEVYKRYKLRKVKKKKDEIYRKSNLQRHYRAYDYSTHRRKGWGVTQLSKLEGCFKRLL